MRFGAAKVRLILAASVALLCAQERPRAAASAVGKERAIQRCGGDREALDRGEVVVVDREPTGGEGVALRACGLIDAAPGMVWPVLRDCGKYELFLPGVVRSRLQSRTDEVALCDETIDLPFPLGDLRSLSRAVESERSDGGFERRWSLVHGDYRRLDGSWTLLPWNDDDRRTLAIYDLDMDPETIIPDFALRGVQSSTAPRVFRAIRERVRRCGGATPAPACEAN